MPEFKEIRKEWKARKKAEDAARKQQEDGRGEGQTTPAESQTGHEGQQSFGHSTRLPPPQQLNYNPASYPSAPQFSSSAADYSAANYITAPQGYPSSPYAPSHSQVYGSQGELLSR